MDINNLWAGYDLNSKKQNTRCLAVNTILEGKYLVGPVLGQGGFGITYVGYDLNMEAKIAIKEYFPVELVSRDTTTMHGDRVLSLSGEKSVTYKAGLKKYVAEAQNVSQFSEIPGVVSVKDFFYANETAYIVMEYIDGISLKDYLKEKGGRLTEEETLKIMKPVLEALVQVHKSGIIHRDISPDNIMLTFAGADENGAGIAGSGNRRIKSVKLIDFGAARMTAKNDQKSLTIILKHGYAPEEQYRTHGEQGTWTDVYALCAVLYRMLTGETPVPAMDRMFQDELKTLEQYGAKVSANTSAAILKGLAVKKDDRIQSVRELIGALYEGAKIKAALSAKLSNAKKIGLIGVGTAVAVAAVIAMIGIGGNTRVDETKQTTSEYAGEMNLAPVEEGIAARPEILAQGYKQTLLDGAHMRLAVRDDGTVHAQGRNQASIDEIGDWTDVCAVAGGQDFSMALRIDGTVLVVDDGIQGIENAEQWTNIVSISADAYSAFGLCLDGTVVSIGENDNGQCEVSQWTDITAVDTSGSMTVGAKRDGTLLAVGASNLDYENGVQKQEERVLATGWTDVVQINAGGDFVFGLQKDGTVLCLNVGGEETEDEILECQRAVAEWEPVTTIHGTSSNTASLVGVTKNGTLEFCGGSYEKKIKPYCEDWTDIKDIELFGSDRLMAKKTDGTFVSTPLPTYGNSLEEMQDLVVGGISDDKIIGLNPEGDPLLYGIGKDKITEQLKNWTNLKMIDVSFTGNVGAVNEDGYCFLYGADDDIRAAYQSGEEGLLINGKKATQVSMGVNHQVILLEDGTVSAWGNADDMYTDHETGKRPSGSCDVEDWENIIAVEAYGEATIGLKEDKTLIAVGEYPKEILEWKNIEYLTAFGWDEIAAIDSEGKIYIHVGDPGFGHANISGWDGLMKEIALSSTHTVGLCKDGTVKAVGSNSNKQCEVEEWTNIKHVYVREGLTMGITENGELKIAGMLDPDAWVIEEKEENTSEDALTSNENNATGSGEGTLVFGDSSEDELGPQIVWPKAETMVAGGFNHVVALKNDGTVQAAGENLRGQCEVTDWDNVAAVYASESISLGLRTDGTVLTSGRMTRTTVSGADLSSWSGIVDLAVCNTHVLGLTEDGHVISAGNGESGCCDTGNWENIEDIWCMDGLSFGVDQNGVLLTAGEMPQQEDAYQKVKTWRNIVDMDSYGGSGRYTIYGIMADGTAVCAGDQEDNMTESLAEWENVTSIEVGDGFVAGLKSDGTLVNAQGGQNQEIENWENVEALASTMYEVIGLKEDGALIMTEPVVTGTCSLEEILAMNDLKEAVWSDACLYALNEVGNINLVGYVEYWRDEGTEEGSWTNIESISACGAGIVGRTSDKKVKQLASRTFTFDYDETLGLSREEQNQQAQERKRQTPILWETWKDVASVVRSGRHTVALMENGEVKTAGEPSQQTKDGVDYKTGLMLDGSSNTSDWSDIKQVAVLNGLTVGLKADGTLVGTGQSKVNWEEYSQIESIWSNGDNTLWAISKDGKAIQILGSETYGQGNTSTWENLIQLSPGAQHTVGLKADGTVVAVGSNFCGQCDVEEWTDIVSVSAGPTSTTGITSDGRILMAGTLPKDVWVAMEWGPIDMTKVQKN